MLAAALAGLAASVTFWAALAGASLWLQGGGSFVEWALAACPALLPAALLLLLASVLRRPHRAIDLVGSVVAVLFAGGLSLLVLLAFLAFDSGPGAPMQGAGLAMASIITVFFLALAGRAIISGFGDASPIGWWWPVTGSLLGLLPLYVSRDIDLSAIVSCGAAIGYWLTRMTPGRRSWAVIGLTTCAGVLVFTASVMTQLAESTAFYPPIASTAIVLLGPLVPVVLGTLLGPRSQGYAKPPAESPN